MISKIFSLGITPQTSPAEQKKIRTLNQICFVVASVCLFFMVYNLFTMPFNLKQTGTLLSISLFMSTCIYLQRLELYYLARMILIISACLMFFYNANYSFRGFYGEYNYLLLPFLSIFFFNQRWMHILSLITAIILFYLPNEFYHIYPEKYFGYANVTTLFIGATAIVYYFKSNNLRSEKALALQKKFAVDLMEQKLLRAQMNPHFMFNAMEAVQNSILDNDPTKASQDLVKFSRLIRANLEHSREDYLPISEEITLLQKYLAVYNSSSNSQIELNIKQINIDFESLAIPSLLLQPFIENSLIHGFMGIKTGEISMKFHKAPNHLAVTIEDNGTGLRTTAMKEHKSLSSIITKERLALMSEEKATKFNVQIQNRFNEQEEITGAKVTLQIPFRDLGF